MMDYPEALTIETRKSSGIRAPAAAAETLSKVGETN